MADSKDHLDWIAFAEDDWASGEELLEHHPRNASSLFQQSAEKYLKAILVMRGREPRRTHDLVELLSIVEPTLPAESVEVRAAKLVTAIYPSRRYPADMSEPTVGEANALQRAAGSIREYARSRLKP